MFKNIYLYNHVNYYERKIKRYDTIAEYGDPLAIYTGINFVLNDGINTKQVLNYDIDNGTPDYALIVDDTDNTFTRWYVIEAERNRKGQCVLTLHRDVIAENLNEVLNATTYVEKGYVQDRSNPVIFADEQISTSMLPKEQQSLNKTNAQSFYYIYLAKSGANLSKTVTYNGKITTNLVYSTLDAFKSASGLYINNNGTYELKHLLTSAEMSSLIQGTYSPSWQVPVRIQAKITANVLTNEVYQNTLNVTTVKNNHFDTGSGTALTSNNYGSNIANYCNTSIVKDYMTDMFYKVVNNTISNSVIDSFNSKFGGKTIAVGNSTDGYTYYFVSKISVSDTVISNSYSYDGTTNLGVQWGYYLLNAVNHYRNASSESELSKLTPTGNPCLIEYSYKSIGITLNQITSGSEINFILSSGRNHCNDQSYDILAIPYVTYSNTVSPYNSYVDGTTRKYFKPNKEEISGFVQKLIQTYGLSSSSSGVIYDVERLPVVPNGYSILTTNAALNLQSSDEGVTWTLIHDADNNPKFPILYLSTSQINSTVSVNVNAVDDDDTNYEFKAKYLTRKYELVANNHSAKYEIPVYMNNVPNALQFNYSGTLFPYNPYIRIDITYSGLNGENISMCRGLVLSGNYSETQLTDAWTQYQYQNTNYQAIFNSQLDYTKAQQTYQRYEQITGIITSAIGSSTNLGVSSAILSGNIGLGLGAGLATGLVSAGAGAVDYIQAEKLRNKTIDYTKEQFNLQLGNVQALAPTITKLTAINIDDTIMPTLITYTSSDVEYNAVLNKLKYNGMTVNLIDKLNNYIGPNTTYLKGKIIEININEDFNYKNELANEVYQGFRLEE